MKTVSKTFFTLLLGLATQSLQAANIRLIITNPLDLQRQELAEIPVDSVYARLGVAEGTPFVVRNGAGQQVTYQITHDRLLLIDAAVRAKGHTSFTIAPGTPEPMRPWVGGKLYPLRKDDIGWENDRGAYRVYGPALQRTGETSYGIDVWTKNSKELTMSERYYQDYEGNVEGWANRENGRKNREIDLHTSFHLDQGDGLDCYGVGPSMGCGTPALMEKGDLVLPYCYETYKIVDKGPLRFTLDLTFGKTRVGNDSVVEHREISLDKGSNYNRMVVWYDGLTRPRDVAAGVVIHESDTRSTSIGQGYALYADPTEHPDQYGFQIFVGVLFPDTKVETQRLMLKQPAHTIAGHAVGIRRGLKAGERFTYYFGSAWSSYDVRTLAEWQLRSTDYLQTRIAPLTWSLTE